jgi:hypothetical protein
MRMKWKLALIVLGLTLIPAAKADSFDFQAAGSLAAGTASVFGRIASGRHWGVTDELISITDVTTGHVQTGMLGTIDLVTGALMKSGNSFFFTGGTVDVDGLHGQSLFDATFMKGSVSTVNGVTILTGRFMGGGATLIKEGQGDFSTQVLTGRHGAVIPEPASLVLMSSGFGLIALLWKRKFRCSGRP